MGRLQALNASLASPSANKLAVLTYHQAVPMQCGPCRQCLAPVYPSDPPPPTELVLDPRSVFISCPAAWWQQAGQGCWVALLQFQQDGEM